MRLSTSIEYLREMPIVDFLDIVEEIVNADKDQIDAKGSNVQNTNRAWSEEKQKLSEKFKKCCERA